MPARVAVLPLDQEKSSALEMFPQVNTEVVFFTEDHDEVDFCELSNILAKHVVETSTDLLS